MASAPRFSSQRRVLLPGSEKKPFAPAVEPKVKQPAPGGGRIQVSVIVPPKQPLGTKRLGKPDARLTRAQLATQHGADPLSVKLVKAFAKEFDLTVEPVTHPGRCTLHLV